MTNPSDPDGGNLDLGVNIMNWITGAEHMITVQPRPALDSALRVDQATLYLIAFTFLFGLPLAFAVTGGVVWWRRRKPA